MTKILSNSFHIYRRGFVALLAVLLLAAAGVAVAVSLFYLGINASQTAATFQEGEQAKAIANACVELGLQQLVTSSAYIGTGTLTLGQGTCTYTVLSLSGGLSDAVEASATVGQTTRKVKVTIGIPSLTITSWQEVGDF